MPALQDVLPGIPFTLFAFSLFSPALSDWAAFSFNIEAS